MALAQKKANSMHHWFPHPSAAIKPKLAAHPQPATTLLYKPVKKGFQLLLFKEVYCM